MSRALASTWSARRSAPHVAEDPSVAVVVSLAPWVNPTEPARLLEGQRVVLLHGVDDRRTDPAATAALVGRAQGVARSDTVVRFAGQGHTLLDRGDAAGRLSAQLAGPQPGRCPTAKGDAPAARRAGRDRHRPLRMSDHHPTWETQR